MHASVSIKDANGKIQHLKHCIFSDEEWNRLREDWLSYLEKGQPVGGAYKYQSNEAYQDNRPGELLIRFDDIAAIS